MLRSDPAPPGRVSKHAGRPMQRILAQPVSETHGQAASPGVGRELIKVFRGEGGKVRNRRYLVVAARSGEAVVPSLA
jgi:hypothetical protein